MKLLSCAWQRVKSYIADGLIAPSLFAIQQILYQGESLGLQAIISDWTSDTHFV